MGSDFTYLDIAGRTADRGLHELVKETDEYYIIKTIPKNPHDIYGFYVSLISKENYIHISNLKNVDQKATKEQKSKKEINK